jgi:hypothetical protein
MDDMVCYAEAKNDQTYYYFAQHDDDDDDAG